MSTDKVVIFGTKDLASLAHLYLTKWRWAEPVEVVAFCVNQVYLHRGDTFEGKPVVGFETVEQQYPPGEYKFFAPMTQSNTGMDRRRAYEGAKEKGYSFITYISPWATVLNESIGENCFIFEDNTIQPFVAVGDNIIMWSGNHIGHHSTIADHSFFTSHVVLSGHCVVDEHCFFGVNSTIRDGLHIAKGTTVAMGACVVRDTEPWGVYMGVPARRQESVG